MKRIKLNYRIVMILTKALGLFSDKLNVSQIYRRYLIMRFSFHNKNGMLLKSYKIFCGQHTNAWDYNLEESKNFIKRVIYLLHPTNFELHQAIEKCLDKDSIREIINQYNLHVEEKDYIVVKTCWS